MRIKTFEDIIAWQKAKELTLLVYKHCRNNKDFGFRDQYQRSAVSVMNNIAEGYERGSNQDFKRFLYIAKGSSGEVRSLSYVALELEYITKDDCSEIMSLTLQISKMLSAFIKKL